MSLEMSFQESGSFTSLWKPNCIYEAVKGFFRNINLHVKKNTWWAGKTYQARILVFITAHICNRRHEAVHSTFWIEYTCLAFSFFFYMILLRNSNRMLIHSCTSRRKTHKYNLPDLLLRGRKGFRLQCNCRGVVKSKKINNKIIV